MDAPTRDIVDRIKEILRTDLRLGNAVEINDDSPLVGSDLDLDSLDVLLLVSSIEKAFGISIPNDEIDQGAFESVTTLAQFVERRCAVAEPGRVEPGHDG